MDRGIGTQMHKPGAFGVQYMIALRLLVPEALVGTPAAR